MGEAAGPVHRRIEFHAARAPRGAAMAGGGAGRFRMGRLGPDARKRVAASAARSEGQVWKVEKGEEASGSGIDPELRAARMYLRRIGAGLRNLGNTCYLNSVLQCLTYTEPFVAYLQSGKHRSSCRTSGFCALCALQKHVSCALQSTGKILTPVHIVRNLRCISRSFRYSRQEDAHELMVSLLESMHKCCLPSGVPTQSPSAYEKSLVHRIFGGRLRSQVRCTRCSHSSNKFDPFLDLSLEIANAATLVKALQNYTKEELLDGGEKQYNCEHCRQKVAATKRFTIDKAPSVLTVHLKRFSPFNPHQKIDKKVDFSPTLNLKPYVSNSAGIDFKYSLYGVLVHAGWNTQSGHYHCFVRTSSGNWHNLDDNEVHQVREADVLRQKAYMLFYVRDRVKSLAMHKDNDAVNLSERTMMFEKTALMDATIQKGLVKKTLNISSFVKGDMKLQKHHSDDGQHTIISNASQDQCSKKHSSTQVIEAAASLNSDPASMHKASCINPDAAAATLPSHTKQTTSSNERENASPGLADAFVLHHGNCNRKDEQPLQAQQLETDGAFTDPGKDIPATFPICSGGSLGTNGQASDPRTDPFPVAFPICSDVDGLLGANGQASKPQTDPILPSFPICNGANVLLRANGQASEPQTDSIPSAFPICDSIPSSFPICKGANILVGAHGEAPEPQADPFCKTTPSITDSTVIEQIIPTEDTVVSNGMVSSEEDLTGSNEANESTELVNKYDKQATVKELSAKSTGDIANAAEQISVQNDTLEVGQVMVNELSVKDTDDVANAEELTSVQSNALEVEQLKAEKQICCESSTQVLDKDPSNSNLHKKMDLKSKKHVKCPVANLFFGPKQLLLSSLKPHKKRKHKRVKRHSTLSVDIESTANDQQTSTSETVLSKNASQKSHRQKRSRASANSEDVVQMFSKKQHVDRASISVDDIPTNIKDSKDATLSSAELTISCPSFESNQRGSRHFNLLTRGLREITVPRWDDIDMIDTKATELYSRTSSIGYVLDEWDEEYDLGRRKKVKKSKKEDFSGTNPFQELVDIRTRQRRRLKSHQARSGN